jgi:hypothetical protein
LSSAFWMISIMNRASLVYKSVDMLNNCYLSCIVGSTALTSSAIWKSLLGSLRHFPLLATYPDGRHLPHASLLV